MSISCWDQDFETMFFLASQPVPTLFPVHCWSWRLALLKRMSPLSHDLGAFSLWWMNLSFAQCVSDEVNTRPLTLLVWILQAIFAVMLWGCWGQVVCSTSRPLRRFALNLMSVWPYASRLFHTLSYSKLFNQTALKQSLLNIFCYADITFIDCFQAI